MTTLSFRPLFVVAALTILLIDRKRKSLTQLSQRKTLMVSVAFAASYFLVAAIAKLAQLRSGELHNMDFWLFVDLLEQSAQGGIGLTRFAPQGQGWIQHGAVHPFFPLALTLPGVWIIGAKWTALLLNPVALTIGGFTLFLLSRKNWGERGALLWQLAFYFLSANSKTLMYETHPEALYPLLFFCVGLSLQANHRTWTAISSFLLFSLKLDSAGFLIPFAFLLGQKFPKMRHALRWSAVFGLIFQVVLLKGFSSGLLGHPSWKGLGVQLPGSLGGGVDPSQWKTATGILEAVSQSLQNISLIYTSSSFWNLALPVFWSIASLTIFLSQGGLALIYGLVPGSLPLWNYYSAPWVGLIWLGGSMLAPTWILKRSTFWLNWLFFAAAVLGGTAPRWNLHGLISSPSERQRRQALHEAVRCLPSAHGEETFGLLTPTLVEPLWSDLKNRLLSDRWKGDTEVPASARFAWIELGKSTYAYSASDALHAWKRLNQTPGWHEPTDCIQRISGFPAEIKLLIRTGN